jgi:ABC-type uncharacterized transport system auxiliary subunit
MTSRKLILRSLLSIGLGVSLSGCFSVLPDPKPANVIYRLSSNAASVTPNANAEIIRIDRPAATQIFNSTDIVVTTDGQKLSVISQANWAEAAPVLIQTSLMNALAGSRNFIGLIPTSGARTETRLHLEVSNFEARFDGGKNSAPLAVVSYRVTYARADDRRLIGTYAVEKTARAESINVSSIVSAIDAANNSAMSDIVAWLETQSSSNRS